MWSGDLPEYGKCTSAFANEAAIGGIGLCFDEEHAYCIEVTEQITKEFLLEKLSKLNESCGRFVMFDIKEAMKWLPIKNSEALL